MNNRLCVGNLSHDTTADGLRSCFAELGNVTDTHVVKDRDTGRARGFAFVTMATEAEATHASPRETATADGVADTAAGEHLEDT